MPILMFRFILEGIPAVLVGILVYFYLPDYPETAKFLTQDERLFASERMGPYAPKGMFYTSRGPRTPADETGTDKHFDKADFIATVKSWQFWVFAIQYFFMTNSLNAFGYFAPTIIANLGFKGCQ